MNNTDTRSMNKIFNTIASTMVMFALLVSAFAAPVSTVVAVTELDSQFGFDTNLDFDTTIVDWEAMEEGESGEVVTSSNESFTECSLAASRDLVTIGESITLNWDTTGFTDITIDGEAVSQTSGSKTITNLQESTIFTLEALNDSGSRCVERVEVTCIPPEEPKECELIVGKTVDAAAAIPGQDLEYTITVKNIGDADCTGGGVKIEDTLDDQVQFIGAYPSSNITAGYGGLPVYTSGDHTLHFNGNVFSPNETGTIKVVVQVTEEPAQCGDFEVKNQAKATAAELNNFQTWVYSPVVKTEVDHNCTTPDPCELTVNKTVDVTTAEIGQELTYTITVKNTGDEACTGSGVMIEDVLDQNLEYLRHTLTSNLGAGYLNTPVYTTNDRTLHFNGFDLDPNESGTIVWVGQVQEPSQCGDFEVKNQAKATAAELNNFQTWAYSPVVKTVVDNECYVPQPPSCTLVPSTQTVGYGGSAVLTWTTEYATEVVVTEFGDVDLDGTGTTDPLYTDKTYTLTATGPDGQATCTAVMYVTPEPPAPTCTLLPVTQTITEGDIAVLTWTTTNATTVTLTDFGTVAENDTATTAPLFADKTYELVVTGNGKTVTCSSDVVVETVPVPSCDIFSADPESIMVGESSTLSWETSNATEVFINNGIGSVAVDGSIEVSPLADIVYQLTLMGENDQTVTCEAPVTVEETEQPLTCADNVEFTASDTSITRGQEVTLSWSTTDVDTVSISGIDATSLSGSETVSPSDDKTYTLTATRGDESVSCPLTIDVSSGGGGGGSSSPRCELTISDAKISAGEEIVLEWDTSRATEVTLTDDRGKIIFTTDDYLASEKEDYYDGSITLKPTRDTKYTLLAERGSRDEECTAKVELDDSVVVLQSRDQQPLVAGISLSQVPYTGFEAGPVMTVLFYLLLVVWALYITYLLVIRNELANAGDAPSGSDSANTILVEEKTAVEESEMVRPDAFVASVDTSVRPTHVTPINLPTGNPVVGYGNHKDEEVVNPHQVDDSVVAKIENQAHAQKALLSSDAIRYFVGEVIGESERREALDAVIVEAKKAYPLEDGWIVINEARMQNLCEVCKKNPAVTSTPATVPEGAGSLAEAIVTGNVVAAYEMIGNRPMFALADAAADLDAVYRNRRGGDNEVSTLLTTEAEKFSDSQIKNMIEALTSALDGTYTDEASAVKMAIMKAVKAGA